MRRAIAFSPLALLVSGCEPLQEPPATAADWSDALPVVDISAPSRADAIRAWSLPPGDPWAPYAKYTLLSALGDTATQVRLPDVEALDDVQRARTAGTTVAATGLPADTLWVVDMRGAASVAFGTALSHGPRPVSLVPTFNNWPGEKEMVPAEETLAALVSMSPALPPDVPQAGVPVFLLDSWRMAFKDDEPDDDTYDNRYFLGPVDLPLAASLNARGIDRVVYVVDRLAEVSAEDDDLHAIFAAWQDAGIRIAIVDLDVLMGVEEHQSWDGLTVSRWLDIVPRVTIFDSPGFFRRARGGFGGVRARPTVVLGGGQGTVFGGHSAAFGGHGAFFGGHGGGFGGHGGGG
jgi:hypothetical protein